MNRKSIYIREGMRRSNDYSWSGVNFQKQHVLFGAWDEEKLSEEGGRRIFSLDWAISAKGHKSKSFQESLHNIQLVIQYGYKLFILPMWQQKRTDGRIVIGGVRDEIQECFVVHISTDFYAVCIKDDKINELIKSTTRLFLEGQSFQVLQTGYERSEEARRECLALHGYKCSVCEISFEKYYGDIGRNYIHVHHLTRMAERTKPYLINGAEELRPLCPNCHAMLHRRRPAYSVEELVDLRNAANKSINRTR